MGSPQGAKRDYQPSAARGKGGQSETLTAVMADMRARGMDYAAIGEELEFSSHEVAQRVHDYLVDNYGSLNVAEQRMLQLKRLETVMNALWETAMTGDVLSEGKQTKNLLDVLNQITELLDLKKDRVRDEIVQLTRAQTELVYSLIEQMRVHLYRDLLAAVRAVPASGTGEEAKALLAARLESAFPEVYAEAAAKAQLALEEGPSLAVQVGGSYGESKVAQ